MTSDYRLDVVTDPDPDLPQAVLYFTAAGVDPACRQAQRLLAAVDGPADRYGELYAHAGDEADRAAHVDTIHLPA